MREVWQTTNQQPWVEAIASKLITVKTRVGKPSIPEGAVVLLHASKARLWPDWKGLAWTKGMDPGTWDRGKIVAIGIVEKVGWTENVLQIAEYKFWDVAPRKVTLRIPTFYQLPGEPKTTVRTSPEYNSAAQWAVRFKNVQRLKNPVAATGRQTPFSRASKETIARVLAANPDLKSFLD
jgi:hypothetical protein